MEEIRNYVLSKDDILNVFPSAEILEDGSVNKYTDTEGEYNVLKRGVGVRDISNTTILKLIGNDTKDFIHRISTNSVKELEDNHFITTLFTNEKGRLIDKAQFLDFKDLFFLIGSLDEKKRLRKWIENFIIMEDIKVEDVTDDYLLFEFHGPQTESYITALCGKEMESLENGEIRKFNNVDGFDFYLIKVQSKIETKYLIFVEKTDPKKFIEFLEENKSVFDFRFVGQEAFDSYRIEEMIPLFPNEINSSFNPYDVGLIDYVDFKKGCFIGQEVIARLETYNKVQKNFTLFKTYASLDKLPLEIPDENGAIIGTISSVTKGLHNGTNYGLAVIKRKALDEGKEISVNENELKILKVI